MSENTMTRDERAALNAKIITTIDALSPDYQIAAFFFAAMLSDDTEPHADPEQTECRMMLRAFRAKQAFEKTAADPDTDTDERSKAEFGSRICGIMYDTLRMKQAAQDPETMKGGAAV
jgi:hypothetical protein